MFFWKKITKDENVDVCLQQNTLELIKCISSNKSI